MTYALNVIAVSGLLSAVAWLATRSGGSARTNHAIWTGALFATPIAAALIFAVPVTHVLQTIPEQSRERSPWPILWAIGSAFLVFRLGSSYVRLLILKRRDAVAVPDERIRELRQRAGMRIVRVVVSPHANVPQFAGLGSAVVLIPAHVGRSSASSDIDCVVIHELVHANAYHDVLRALQEVVVAAFFFSPFVHLLARRADFERELVADIETARIIGSAHEYAALLARVAFSGNAEVLAPAIRGRSSMRRRLQRLLGAGDVLPSLQPGRFALVSAMSVVLLATASPFLAHRMFFELAPPVGIPAPQADNDAAGHYGSGLSLYWSGHYAEAAHEFSAAFEGGYDPANTADGAAESYAALGDEQQAALWRARSQQ